MKRELLICICALTVVASTIDRIYACCEKPVADFTMTSNDVVICEEVSFNGSSSYDPDNTVIQTYSWDFGSGACDIDSSDNLPNASCRYSTGGNKTVTLTVTDNDNPDCCDSEDPNCIDKTSDEYSLSITVAAPTGEDSTFFGWSGPKAYFKGKLTPTADNFSGISVEEVDGGGGTDGCHFTGSAMTEYDHLTGGGTWTIVAGNWYDAYDAIGWGIADIIYYRSNPPGSPSAQCSTTLTQCMVVDCPCSIDEYTNHPIILTIGTTTITGERDGVSETRIYP
jgi:hypothetical protein